MARHARLLIAVLLLVFLPAARPPATAPQTADAIDRAHAEWREAVVSGLDRKAAHEAEFQFYMEQILGPDSAAGETTGIIRHLTLQQLAGDSSGRWERPVFLEPDEVDLLRTLAGEAKGRTSDLPPSASTERTAAMLDRIDSGLRSPIVPPTDSAWTSERVSEALEAVAVERSEVYQEVLGRHPSEADAPAAAELAQQLALERSAPDEAAVRLIRPLGEAGDTVADLAWLASREAPATELPGVIRSLYLSDVTGGTEGRARASVQIGLLRDALGGELPGYLKPVDRRALVADLERIRESGLYAREGGDDGRLRRHQEHLTRRLAELREAGATSGGSAVRSGADEGLVLAVHHELYGGSEPLAGSAVSDEEFRRATQLVGPDQRREWEQVLGEQEARIGRTLAASDTNPADPLDAALSAVKDGRGAARKPPKDLKERLESVLAPEHKEAILAARNDAREVELSRMPMAEEPVERARLIARTGPPRDPPPMKPAPPDSPLPKGPPPRHPKAPAGGGAALNPKGVRLSGTLVLPGAQVMGAGYDPATGSIYLSTDGDTAAMPLTLNGRVSDEDAVQILLGVYRAVFLEAYDDLYLSIDPIDPAKWDDDDILGHGKLEVSYGPKPCGTSGKVHCHNQVVTFGDVEDTLVGQTLYQADTFFKGMMLGVSLDTGRREALKVKGYASPVSKWEDNALKFKARLSAGDADLLRDDLAGHESERARHCRMWFDMTDMQVVTGSDGSIRFGDTPVYAHTEAMRLQGGQLVAAPNGDWCPDSKVATQFINKNWGSLSGEYDYLARLDLTARLVAFFTWARDLESTGVFLDFDVLDDALAAGALKSVRTPRYTSGIAKVMEPIQGVVVDTSAAVFWRRGENGLEIGLRAGAADKVFEMIKARANATPASHPARSEAACAGEIQDSRVYAACANAVGLTASDILRSAIRHGWAMEEVEYVEGGNLCEPTRYSGAEADLPASDGPLACLWGVVTEETAVSTGVSWYHGGVTVGGRGQSHAGETGVGAEFRQPGLATTAVIGTATKAERNARAARSWHNDGRTLSGIAYDEQDRRVEEWTIRGDKVETLSGRNGTAYVVWGGAASLIQTTYGLPGCVRRTATHGGDLTTHETCEGMPDTNVGNRLRVVETPDAVVAWERAAPNRPRTAISPGASSRQWLRYGIEAFSRGDYALARLVLGYRSPAMAIADGGLQGLLRSFEVALAEERERLIWRAEVELAAADPAQALAMLDDPDDPAVVALTVEAGLRTGVEKARVEAPAACRGEPSRWTTADAEACARMTVIAARGASTSGSAAASAHEGCSRAPIPSRCEALVRLAVTAPPDARCDAESDPRARWRCVLPVDPSTVPVARGLANAVATGSDGAVSWWLRRAEGTTR